MCLKRSGYVFFECDCTLNKHILSAKSKKRASALGLNTAHSVQAHFFKRSEPQGVGAMNVTALNASALRTRAW